MDEKHGSKECIVVDNMMMSLKIRMMNSTRMEFINLITTAIRLPLDYH